MNLEFSCTLYKGKGLEKTYHNLMIKIDPNKDEMLDMLDNLKSHIGAAGLKFDIEPDVGIYELSVLYDGNKYLFTLIEYGLNGEYLIRTKKNVENDPGLIDFMGEPYPSPAITRDFEFIKKVFIEFLETRNISYDLMD